MFFWDTVYVLLLLYEARTLVPVTIIRSIVSGDVSVDELAWRRHRLHVDIVSSKQCWSPTQYRVASYRLTTCTRSIDFVHRCSNFSLLELRSMEY